MYYLIITLTILIVGNSTIVFFNNIQNGGVENNDNNFTTDGNHNITSDSLHVEGRWIIDENGETLLLRGVNRGQFHTNPSGWWCYLNDPSTNQLRFDPEAVKENLDAMQDWGINVLRLYGGISFWKWDTPDRTNFGEYPGDINRDPGPHGNHKQHIKDIITWAGQKGIYVVYVPWCVRGTWNPLPHQDTLPFPPYLGNYNYDDTEVIASKDEFVKFWRDFAAEMKDYPNLIFELWNEPHGRGKEDWITAAQECIDAIRSTGAENLIIVQWEFGPSPESNYSFQWVDEFGGFTGGNIVYSTHIYWHNGHLGKDKPTEYEVIKDRLHQLFNPYLNNFPIWIGEFGVNDIEDEDNLIATENLLKVLNEMGLGYAQWEWYLENYRDWGIYQRDGSPGAAGRILYEAIDGDNESIKQGRIKISTQPVEGTIYINDEYVGTGEYSSELPVGEVTVSYGKIENYTSPEPETVLLEEGLNISVVGEYLYGTIQILGNTEQGEYLDNAIANKFLGTRFWAGSSNTASNIQLHWSVHEADHHIKAAIYTDNNSKPDTLLMETMEYMNNDKGTLKVTLDLLDVVTLEENNYYWIIAISDYGGLYYAANGTSIVKWCGGYCELPEKINEVEVIDREYSFSVICYK